MSFDTRLTQALIKRFTRAGHWGAETFYQILDRRAAAHPEREGGGFKPGGLKATLQKRRGESA